MAINTTASAEYPLPVDVRFTCAKCGRDAVVTETVYVGTSIGGRNLSAQTAETLLKGGLPSDAQKQLGRIAESWEKGVVLPYDALSYHRFHPAVRVECPCCRTQQFPAAGGNTAPVRGRRLGAPTVLSCALALGWMAGMFAVLAGRPVRPMGLLYVTLAWIAAQAAVLFWGRALSRRALRDPAYMEKRFDGVVNTAVTADFTPYGLGVIVLNSKKR